MTSSIDLSSYGITDTIEIIYNPSYEQLFAEETRADLEGYEKGIVTELGAVDVSQISMEHHCRSNGVCFRTYPKHSPIIRLAF